jgi:hypothetical protein
LNLQYDKPLSDFAFKFNLRRHTPAPYRDLWLVAGEVADCADKIDPIYKLPGRESLRPSGWWPVDADFWQRWFAAGLVVGRCRSIVSKFVMKAPMVSALVTSIR